LIDLVVFPPEEQEKRPCSLEVEDQVEEFDL
jgi:hypothetical protein